MIRKRVAKTSNCTLFTIGHSTRSLEEFVSLLRAWGVEILADVRSVPRSRRNPQFNADTLPAGLRDSGIDYIRLPALGGWRRPQMDSPNAGWRLASFRGFADYMLSNEFKDALDNLIALACAGPRLALMCAEAVPWRCHRSLISDALTATGYEVCHIMSVEKANTHRMTPFARVDGDLLT